MFRDKMIDGVAYTPYEESYAKERELQKQNRELEKLVNCLKVEIGHLTHYWQNERESKRRHQLSSYINSNNYESLQNAFRKLIYRLPEDERSSINYQEIYDTIENKNKDFCKRTFDDHFMTDLEKPIPTVEEIYEDAMKWARGSY